MTYFFWWCAGVHRETLQKHPQEHSKYSSIGATIFFTALFAALAGGYAMYFVFSGSALAVFAASGFGILWGLAIFNLDRYIVLTLDKSRNAGWQMIQALPRLILAIIIGLVISRPLELKIFDKEIRTYLRTEYLERQRAQIDTLNSTFENKYLLEYGGLTRDRMEADSLESSIQRGRQQLNHEIFGTKTQETSGVLGYGPYAQMKSEQLQKQERSLDSLRSRIRRDERALQVRKEDEGLAQQPILAAAALDSVVQLAGFSDRNRALGNLHIQPDGTIDTSVEYAVRFIALLFIFFECLPVLVKLMSSRDPYDVALRTARDLQNLESQTILKAEAMALDKLVDTHTEHAIRRRAKQFAEE